MKQKSPIEIFFSKRIGELLETMDYANVDPKLKEITKKSVWRICDELQGKFNLQEKVSSNETLQHRG